MAADNAPLIEIGYSEVRRARGFQTPGGKEIIFSARTPNRSLFFFVDVNLFVAFAEPGWAAGADCEHGADVVPFALSLRADIILAVLHWVFLPVLGIEVRRVVRQTLLFYPIDIVIEQA